MASWLLLKAWLRGLAVAGLRGFILAERPRNPETAQPRDPSTAKDRLELKLGGRRRRDHQLISPLLRRPLGQRTGKTRNFDERWPHLECCAARRVCDDFHRVGSETA